MSDEQKAAIETYVDALDHIRRVCHGSRTQTRRLRWIEARARCAVEGGHDWRDLDLPKIADSESKRYFEQKSRIETLEADLSAERARRIKAEEVVDAAVAQNKNGILYERAYNYRAQYPRVEKEQAFEWQCPACGAMLPSSEKHCPCRFEQQEP